MSSEEVNVGEVLCYVTPDCDGDWSRCIRTTNRPNSTDQKLPLEKKKADANLCASSKLFPWSSVNLSIFCVFHQKSDFPQCPSSPHQQKDTL